MRDVDRVLLVLVGLRSDLRERALAAIFGVSRSTARGAIAALLRRIAALFGAWVHKPGSALLLVGALIAVHDRRLARPSKNYRRSVNVRVVASRSRRVVRVGFARPGNRNEIVVARAAVTLPPGAGVLTDGGYRSFAGVSAPPRRGRPRPLALFGAEERAPDEDALAALAEHRRVGARIEHMIARLKDWLMLGQCRRKGNAIDRATRAVALLNDLRLR